jgi:flagellar FliJ protein
MKRFRFSLRSVAVLRAHRELRAREAFGAAVQAFVESEQAVAAVRARVAAFEAELAAGRRTKFSAAEEARALTVYREECAAERRADEALAAARTLMGQRRAEYLEAHRRLEVVKRLEEKARLLHRLGQQREEQTEFDELAGRRHARRSSLSA